jgi:hypothetical protein
MNQSIGRGALGSVSVDGRVKSESNLIGDDVRESQLGALYRSSLSFGYEITGSCGDKAAKSLQSQRNTTTQRFVEIAIVDRLAGIFDKVRLRTDGA